MRVGIAPGADEAGFRRAVRTLIARGIRPDAVFWVDGEGEPVDPAAPAFRLPGGVSGLVRTVICHGDAERHALLYTLIWRVLHGERALLDVASDPLVHRLDRMARAVRRDIHKMRAFVRFREVEEGRFAAWFEPDHFIVEANAPFFRDRFPSFAWSILTPMGSVHWDRQSLRYGPPATRAEASGEDPWEAAWRTYYASTFNPARVNARAMQAEMPRKYWKNLPEAALIPELLRAAEGMTQEMIAREARPSRRREPQAALDAMPLYRTREKP